MLMQLTIDAVHWNGTYIADGMPAKATLKNSRARGFHIYEAWGRTAGERACGESSVSSDVWPPARGRIWYWGLV